MALYEEFHGKVVLVTGSSSGIGATTALSFAKLGAKVVVTGRDANKVEEVSQHCQQLSPHNYEAVKFVGDLGDDETIDKLVDLIVEKHNRLDVLVNNAGRFIEKSQAHSLASFDEIHKFPGVLPYCVSKAGVDMLTRCLAIDWGPKGIRVNSINPGQIQTPIFTRCSNLEGERLDLMWRAVREKYPLKREGQTEDVSNAIIFLASNNSSFITGVQLKIDGGFVDSSDLAMDN